MTPRIPVPLDTLKNAGMIDRFYKEKRMLAFSLWPADPAGTVVDMLVYPEATFEVLQSQAITKSFLGV
jgi:hypothetical protein